MLVRLDDKVAVVFAFCVFRGGGEGCMKQQVPAKTDSAVG